MELEPSQSTTTLPLVLERQVVQLRQPVYGVEWEESTAIWWSLVMTDLDEGEGDAGWG